MDPAPEKSGNISTILESPIPRVRFDLKSDKEEKGLDRSHLKLQNLKESGDLFGLHRKSSSREIEQEFQIVEIVQNDGEPENN